MDDDIVYTYRGSWSAEGLRSHWESEWRIIGDKGSVTWDGAKGFRAQEAGRIEGYLAEQMDVEIPPYTTGDTMTGRGPLRGHAALIHDFCDAVRTGRTPTTICTDNIHSLAMVFGAIDSAKRGIRLSINNEMN
jgi:predicted dehydrogenase